jgi:hypothetical protein
MLRADAVQPRQAATQHLDGLIARALRDHCALRVAPRRSAARVLVLDEYVRGSVARRPCAQDHVRARLGVHQARQLAQRQRCRGALEGWQHLPGFEGTQVAACAAAGRAQPVSPSPNSGTAQSERVCIERRGEAHAPSCALPQSLTSCANSWNFARRCSPCRGSSRARQPRSTSTASSRVRFEITAPSGSRHDARRREFSCLTSMCEAW